MWKTLAAIAVAQLTGSSFEQITKMLEGSMEHIGGLNGSGNGDILVYDDYAHHPLRFKGLCDR